MVSKTNEQALESAIEKSLTGTCLEDKQEESYIQEPNELYSSGNGYYMGKPNDLMPNLP